MPASFYGAILGLIVVDWVICVSIFFYFELLDKATSKISFVFEKKKM